MQFTAKLPVPKFDPKAVTFLEINFFNGLAKNLASKN